MDRLTILVQALNDDQELWDWYEPLGRMPDNLRISQIGQMIQKMKRSGESSLDIAIMESLFDRRVFDAVCNAVLDLRRSDKRPLARFMDAIRGLLD